MKTCIECGEKVYVLDQQHLFACCGLTLQEYALRHGLPLELLIPEELLNQKDSVKLYPSPQTISLQARRILTALVMASQIKRADDFYCIEGAIRKLDQLLWLQQQLAACGFLFRQEFIFNDETHRVVARNVIKVPRKNISLEPLPIKLQQCTKEDWTWFIAVLLASHADYYAGYLYFYFDKPEFAEALQEALADQFAVGSILLPGNCTAMSLLRTHQKEDATKLLQTVAKVAQTIPALTECYYAQQPQALVAKQMSFDSAHFITDHPGKCANLHGGRYELIVKIKDRIDPHTGFVVDYGVLKNRIKDEVIDRLDHKHLNLADRTLAWRSSSEYLLLFIWQQLLPYFPNLYEVQLYETAQSYCTFRGPTLDALQAQGGKLIPAHFQSDHLGLSSVRKNFKESLKSNKPAVPPQVESL